MWYSAAREWPDRATQKSHRGMFSAEECAKAIMLAQTRAEDPGVREAPGRPRIYTLASADPRCRWLFEKVAIAGETWTSLGYSFEFEAIADIQIARFKAGEETAYHEDIGAGPASRRKLSVVAMLNPPEGEAGGRLELWSTELAGHVVNLEAGDAMMFPSWQTYRISPSATGIRWVLTGWLLGAPFR